MKTAICDMSAMELSAALTSGALSSAEVTGCYLERIEKHDCDYGAYITVANEDALRQAEAVDRRRASGEALSPLAGIPFAVKDNICTSALKTTCGAKMLRAFVPAYDAEVVEKLLGLGMVLLGKTNMDEFGMGCTTESSYFGASKNPRDVSRVPGGSSGGSAAAVAAGLAPIALGSDTGGSIRQPASFCGVVGMKPTYGSVSRYGLIAFASSLDQIGPLARNVRDSAMLIEALSGHDPKDMTSVERDCDYALELESGAKGLRIGIVEELTGEGVDPRVREAVLVAAARYEAMGAIVEPVSMPELAAALPAYYVISCAEASSNLARFDGIRYDCRVKGMESGEALYGRARNEGFGVEVKRRIMLGTFALSSGYYDAYYLKAQRARTLISRAFAGAFERFDALISPVAPTVAFELGKKVDNPVEMYLGDVCTVPVSIAGLPAISFPCGMNDNKLPIGLQIIGNAFAERTLYRLAHAYEREAGTFDDMLKKEGR